MGKLPMGVVINPYMGIPHYSTYIYIYIHICIYIYSAEYPQRQGPRFSQAGSQKGNWWYCCPTELIPNVDLDRWLPQPQRNGCYTRPLLWLPKYPGRRERYPFHLWIAPSGTTPSGPMASESAHRHDVWRPLWQPCMTNGGWNPD